MTISERLNNEQKRLQTLFVIENGKGYYLEDNKAYTREEFEKKYPVPLRTLSPEGENIDGTRNWLYH